MPSDATNPIADIAEYYSAKLSEHGQTPKGVDWNGEASQILRFEQLAKILRTDADFSLNDIGCGYGAFFEFLTGRASRFTYTGLDISADMVQAARQRYANERRARFIAASKPDSIADYGVASGIFNVRLNRTEEEWTPLIEAAIDDLAKSSKLGFAFNCLTSYSDIDKKRDYLFYADPCRFFDLCKRRYSRDVALLHDYGLYEFTILVRI